MPSLFDLSLSLGRGSGHLRRQVKINKQVKKGSSREPKGSGS